MLGSIKECNKKPNNNVRTGGDKHIQSKQTLGALKIDCRSGSVRYNYMKFTKKHASLGSHHSIWNKSHRMQYHRSRKRTLGHEVFMLHTLNVLIYWCKITIIAYPTERLWNADRPFTKVFNTAWPDVLALGLSEWFLVLVIALQSDLLKYKTAW